MKSSASVIDGLSVPEGVKLAAKASSIAVSRKGAADEFAHVTSIENVSGAKEGSEQYQWFGLGRRVDKKV
ncbi:MAG: hypothetical protein ACI4DX_16565 [Oliverpabstia sp.]